MLQWIILAKRQETRHKRITEIAELAVKGIKPKQFRREEAYTPNTSIAAKYCHTKQTK